MSQTFSTCDLYDSFEHSCDSCETQFKQYGGRRIFSGRIRTVKCVGDNVLVRRTLESATSGDVLIVDGAGFLGSALMGDVIAGLGAKSGWAGVVINGAIRDSVALSKMDFGVKALGSNPKKSYKQGSGFVDIPVSFGGVNFTPGDWVYCDNDGILVSPKKLVEP